MASSLSLPPERYPAHSAPRPRADTLAALSARALAYHRAGRLTEAIAQYERILALKPDLAEAHNNMGLALAGLGELEAAVAAYRRAVALRPDNPEALCNWGLALAQFGWPEAAETKFRRAIALNPGFAGAYNNLALILKESGRIDEARQATEQAIRLAPRNTSYYDNLAAVRPFVAGDPYLTALENLAADAAELSGVERMHLFFALAKAYEQIGKPECAFRHLLAGNALKRTQIVYDEAATLSRMERTRALFTRDFIAARHGGGAPSPLPIFIVGMPRSGTTLIEQILASHPQIFGAGELGLFEQGVEALRQVLPGLPPFPDLLSDLSKQHYRTLGARYLDTLRRRAPAPGAMRITDKMPGNFLYAGLIHMALPNATIIHIMRDPLDTCVSCFSVHFTSGQPHTYDLTELGRYYRHYHALMAHWRDVLPACRFIEVHYEEIVGDLEATARRVIAHCGLAWDAKCLDFHRTMRSVRTASAAQVRQPVYTNSVGRWRKYEDFLGPLIAELTPPLTDKSAAPPT